MLHTASYDFNDTLLSVGCSYCVRLARAVLSALLFTDGPFDGRRPTQKPHLCGVGFLRWGMRSLTITYFHTGNPHYHRRGVVSRSCSGWEGVGPTRYGHQA